MKPLNPKHLILSRTDNIGDVILTLPLAAAIKKAFPYCKITFLARDYVKAIAESSLHLDQFLSWDTLQNLPEHQAVDALKKLEADTILHVFPRKKIATLARKAGIKQRIGTSRRWYHFFTCNYRVKFSRSNSTLHEAQLNLKLLTAFNLKNQYSLEETTNLISLKNSQSLPNKIQALLNPNKFNLVIHPLTNGHTREWPLEYFKELINSLSPEKFNVLVTGSKTESNKLKTLLLEECPHAVDVTGKLTLEELLLLIKASNGLLANSTGPLHIAAACGIHTLGIFPPATTMSPKRWAPLGKKANFSVVDQSCDASHCKDSNDCACIRAITPAQIHAKLNAWAD